MARSIQNRIARLPRGNENGAVLVFVLVGLVAILLAGGLAVDAGRGYVLKANLSRAVDAAALSAARSLRAGQTEARLRAIIVAEANGVKAGPDGTTLTVSFGTNEWGEETVTVAADTNTPTLLMRLIGQDRMDVSSSAVAAVPPVDLVLVLDQSGSIRTANAMDDLKNAAKDFVQHFDDDIDRLGMVSFNIMARDHFQVGRPFQSRARSEIDGLHFRSYTNTGEALRLAYEQFQGPGVRERSAKVVVFFTDGQPSCFRGTVNSRDAVMAAWSSNRVQGLWYNPEALPLDGNHSADTCRGWSRCFGYRRNDVFNQARGNGAFWADRIRSEDILVYTIGLGDTSQPPNSILQPDQDYLRQLANVDGMTDPNQPKGNMYFAPTAAEIRNVFNLVAQDLLARLAH